MNVTWMCIVGLIPYYLWLPLDSGDHCCVAWYKYLKEKKSGYVVYI